MPAHTRYFPLAVGNQILWIKNFRIKLAQRFAELGYSAPEIAGILADCDWSIYLLETVSTAAKQFAQGMTASIKQNLYVLAVGSGVPLPAFVLPSTPTPPPQVAGGALKRIFAFIKTMKTRAQYLANPAIGEDLGVIGDEEGDDLDAAPSVGTPFIRGGEVIVTFVKDGHMGVWVECSIDGGPWQFVVIDTNSPYNDARPIAPGKTAEKRRYRLCFWDGTPTNIWTTTEEIAFGG